ncbi:MAG: hypothetical protein ABR601_09655 [Parasphingopyxis sp.]|nr:hypothetical protein [Sphingomonadales bacterium]
MQKLVRFATLAGSMLLLAACGRDVIEASQEAGVGLLVNRSACPAVATPVFTNEITLFDPPSSRDANAIDVTAVITNIRSTCGDAGDTIQAVATFEVQASRRRAEGPREVVLPYFATVLRAGNQIVSKEVNRVGLRFADGQYRASTTGQATATISRAAATLPAEVEERLTARRRAGDADAAIDPMSDPTVRAAVENATFDLLIGFQLEPQQLEYNVTR